jgi:hypothetical protein
MEEGATHAHDPPPSDDHLDQYIAGLGLDLKQVGLDGDDPTQPAQQGCEERHCSPAAPRAEAAGDPAWKRRL